MQISVGSNIATIRTVQKVGRKPRNPTHRAQLRSRPWQIQPFLLAPVLPGETLENLLFQSRAVTDPIKNKLVGWFKEYYFFYVKLRDLDPVAWAALEGMLITNAAPPASTAAAAAHYYRGDGVNFSTLCLDRVVEEYFRNEDEDIGIATIDGIPLAAIDVNDFTQSLIADSATNSTEEELPGENPTLPAHMAGFADQFAHWEAMRDMGLVEATFEDWLATFGVKAPGAEKAADNKPELLRYVRDWKYPANTIDPVSGAASSAVSWSMAERADKKRFFPEPGFIFGVTVSRPKVYKAGMSAAGSHYLDTPYMWLPAVLHDAPYTSLRKFLAAAGPLAPTAGVDYWVDMKDLFIHGDQFVNFALAADDDNSVALPTPMLENDYADAADADALFNTPATLNMIREDVVVNLRILSASAAEDTSL